MTEKEIKISMLKTAIERVDEKHTEFDAQSNYPVCEGLEEAMKVLYQLLKEVKEESLMTGTTEEGKVINVAYNYSEEDTQTNKEEQL